MKEAIVHRDITVTLHEAPVPTIHENEILIRVVVFGTNPKDWKGPLYLKEQNAGDDIAGVVEAVGSRVYQFKKGDHVAGFHVMEAPGGAFAEYAVVPVHTTFTIPPGIAFEEAATVPLAALTAAFALFHTLQLPAPWQRPLNNTPLIVYGASTSIGAFAVKLASAARIHPIIAIGSTKSAFVKPYLQPQHGDILLDYTTQSPVELVGSIKEALVESKAGNGRCFHAFDAISKPETFNLISEVIAGPAKSGQKPRMAVVVLEEKYTTIDPSIDVEVTYVGKAHSGSSADKLFASMWCSLFSEGLHQGWLKPHPYEIIDGGLNGLENVLKSLRAGHVRGKKMVGRIRDTPSIEVFKALRNEE